MKRVVDRLRDLGRDESGQSLVFGVMTAFLILFFGAMIMGVGRVSARSIQMQFAADSAAYSSALVESECLNAMALLNTGMAQVRGRALRYAADVNAYGVLAELRDEVLKMPERMESKRGEITTLLNDAAGDPDRSSQLQHIIRRLDALHENNYQLGNEPLLKMTDETFWLQQLAVLRPELDAESQPARRTWLQNQIAYCEQMQRGLHVNEDLSQPLLSTVGADPHWLEQIAGVDRADARYAEAYARASDWLPPSNEWLTEMSRLEYTVSILAPYVSAETAYTASSRNGAEYASIFPCSRWLPRDDAYFSLDVYRLGPKWWRAQGYGRAMEVRAQDCAGCLHCPQCGVCTACWLISYENGISEAGRYRVCQLEGRRWYFQDLLRDEEACIQQHEEFSVVTWGPQGVEVKTHNEYSPHWLEIINTNSGNWPKNTIFVRTVDGVVQQAHYKWDPAKQQYVMPDEDDFTALPPATVEVDGVRVSVTIDPVIQLPGRAVIRTLHPPYIELRDVDDNPWGRAYLDATTRFWTSIHGVDVWVETDDFRLRNRGEDFYRNSADGRWRTHFDQGEEYWWQHRLTQVQPDHWQFECMDFGGRLEPERNMARLMALRDVDNDVPPPGESAAAESLPPWAYDPALNPDGWLTPDAGALVRATPQGPLGNTFQYYQVRTTVQFDPLDSNGATEQPDGRWWLDLNRDGVKDADELIVSPYNNGLGYVLIEPSHVFGREGLAERDAAHPRRAAIQADDYQEAGFDLSRLPLVLTDEFFKFGFTAGAWHRSESHFPRGADGAPLYAGDAPERPVEYLLDDPEPGFKGLMRGTPGTTARRRGEVLRPAWGYFALTAARPRLNRPGATGDWQGLEQGALFDSADDRAQWVDDNLNNLYLRPAPGGWTYWDARLVALDRQVLDEDVMLGQSTRYETGVGWLMKRIAEGSPGGLIRSRHQQFWDVQAPHYGQAGGWARDIYGSFDQSYPPLWVRRDLTTRIRPRVPAPVMGAPYIDSEGVLRDPLAEYLADRPFGAQAQSGQINYNDLDSSTVLH